MSDFLDKAKDFAADHDEQVDNAVEKGGDFVDDKTGDKYAQHVDTAQDKLQGATGDESAP